MKNFLIGLGVFLAVALFIVAFTAVEAWTLMLFVGILWGEFAWLAPIGFMAAWGLMIFGSASLAIVSRTWYGGRGTSETYQTVINTVKPKKASVWN